MFKQATIKVISEKKLTNSMEHRRSWEANKTLNTSFKEHDGFLPCPQKKNTTVVHILRQISSIHTLPSCFLKIHCFIDLQSLVLA